jgi:hypothetical protein
VLRRSTKASLGEQKPVAETRIELLEKLWQALKAWRNNPFNFTWRSVGEVMKKLQKLDKACIQEHP